MKRRGAAFILVIAILAALVALLAGALASRRVEFRAQANRMGQSRARMLAVGATQFALATLATQDPNAVNKTNDWNEFATPGTQAMHVDGGYFRVELLDESSFVNLNSADQQQLESLGLTPEQVDSLLDWREPGEDPREEGAKDQFYNSLSEPYNAKLRSLDTVDELLLVKGFSAPQIFEYRESQSSTGGASAAIEAGQLTLYDLVSTDSQSPNAGADGQQKGNINQVGVQQLVARGISVQAAGQIVGRRPGGGYTTMSQVLAQPSVDARIAGTLLDNFIVGTEANSSGKLNVNTASEAALLTLPGITSDVVSAVVSRQSSGFENLTEFVATPGITIANLRQWGDRITVTSNSFRVRALGCVGSTVVCLEGLIRIGGGAPRIVRVWEPPEADMRNRWRWDQDASNDITLSEANE